MAVDETQKKSTIREYYEALLIAVIFVNFARIFAFQAFKIPTGSMEDNLKVGDHIIVNKFIYGPGTTLGGMLPLREIRRGDIIVFRYPVDIRQTFVKRVVGIPGDRIRIENKQVIRNGIRLNEPYKFHKTEYNDSYRDNFPSQPYLQLSEGAIEMLEKHVVNGEVVVPPNSYFAMGDNRDNSLDSRYWGFVPRGNIIGKPLIIYWSYETTTERLASPTISIDHAVDLVQNFFGKTHWRRTFMLIHGYRFQN